MTMTRHELETKSINQPPEKNVKEDVKEVPEKDFAKETKDAKDEKFEKEKENKDAVKLELNEKVKSENEKVKPENEKTKFENEKNVKIEGKNEFKNEVKDKGEKDERKEGKSEFKDDKDAKAEVEPKHPEKPDEVIDPFSTGVSRAALLEHAEALENAARVLRHFIEQAERPDLRRGALHNEPDQADE